MVINLRPGSISLFQKFQEMMRNLLSFFLGLSDPCPSLESDGVNRNRQRLIYPRARDKSHVTPTSAFFYLAFQMSSHLVRVMAVDIQHQNMEDVIPVIDLATLGLQTANVEDVDQLTVDRVCKELDSAFSTTGFFYVENHGVDQTLIDNFFQRSKSFFLLPESTKERYRCGLDNCDGYTGKDGELLDFTALHEIRNSYDVSSPDGLYPDEHAPEFRQAVNELAPPMCELSFRLLRCMAIGLGLEKNFFVDRHLNMFKSAEKNRTIFRTLFYPSLGDADVEPGVVRCGLHSDYGTITILLQDDMGGLEFLTNGKWIPASPIPGKILIFLGDMMQFWTSDRYPATVHRVVVPEEELLRRTPRQSVAFFVHPDNEVMIAPIDGSDKHEPVDALTYVKSRLLASTYK